MKKAMTPVEFSPMNNLKIISEADSLHETAPYFHLQKEFAQIIDFNSQAIPFYTQPLDNGFNRAVKRSLDIFISLIVILFFLPWLIPLIAVFIKLNSAGPVFFLQKRNKRNAELFTCIKFRTMVKNAYADTLPACKNDKRITAVGRFLRNKHLDELPQFFNVLWGDMSVVGPRPHMVSDNLKFDELIKNYAGRHKVKPGITGLAQVLGYLGPVDDDFKKMEGRVHMDIFYTRHWSVKMDIAILLRTITKASGFSS